MRYRAVKSQLRKSLLPIGKHLDICAPSIKYKHLKVLLPLIETAHYKSIQLLLIAKALELRGAEVLVVICGQTLDACEIRSVSNEKTLNPCWQCKFNQQNLLSLFNLKTITLDNYLPNAGLKQKREDPQYPDIPAPYNIKISQCVEDSVVRHYYGNVPSDVNAVSRVREKYQRTATLTWNVASTLHQEFKPNLVLGYMVAYSEWEPYYIYFNSVNIPFSLVSSTQFDGKAQIFHWPDLYLSDVRFRSYVATRNIPKLTNEERKLLESFLIQRKQGLDPVLNELKIAKRQDSEDLGSYGIKIDRSKRNIFIFPNVYWDVGIGGLGNIYNSVVDWVISTAKLVSEHQDCHLYVRCHPAEELNRANGSKGIEDFLKEEFPKLPPNITVIGSGNPVSSYALFTHIDLAVVSVGTIGLELLLDRIPVIVVGKAPYSTLKGVDVPKNLDQYKNALLGQSTRVDMDYDEIAMFAYFYFIRTSIPWNLTETSYRAGILSPLQFDSLECLMQGKDPHLDHLCDCLVDSTISPETW